MKKYRHALVFGKFMPLHNGHCLLIETAAAQSERVTVLVCSLPTEPIAGALRYAWTKSTFPNLNVLHVTDVNPAYPHEHRFFWEIWLDTFHRNAPGVDVVFTSEDYGHEVGRRMGIAHVQVDKARARVPISGTKVRLDPYAHLDFLPTATRAHYCRRIALMGAESSGKTTLSKHLATHFGAGWVEEYGRTYTEDIYAKGQALDLMGISHIAGGQLQREEEEARQAPNGLLFCDTELITTQIWSDIYFKQCPEWIVEASHRGRYLGFLLLRPDIPWVDDQTREFPMLREWHFERLRSELEARNERYAIIGGDFDTRTRTAIETVQGWLAQ